MLPRTQISAMLLCLWKITHILPEVEICFKCLPLRSPRWLIIQVSSGREKLDLPVGIESIPRKVHGYSWPFKTAVLTVKPSTTAKLGQYDSLCIEQILKGYAWRGLITLFFPEQNWVNWLLEMQLLLLTDLIILQSNLKACVCVPVE